MSEHISKFLLKLKYKKIKQPQDAPYPVALKKYGPNIQYKMINLQLQEKITSSIFNIFWEHLLLCPCWWPKSHYGTQYYCKRTNQSTQQIKKNDIQPFNYVTTNLNALTWYRKSYVILIHSDVPCMSEKHAKSHTGYFYLGQLLIPNNGPIVNNGPLFMLYTFLKFIAASAAEGTWLSLPYCKKRCIHCVTFEEIGHKQPLISFHCNNSNAISTASEMVKKTTPKINGKVIFLGLKSCKKRK